MVEAAKPSAPGGAREENKDGGGENAAIAAIHDLLKREQYDRALRQCNASK